MPAVVQESVPRVFTRDCLESGQALGADVARRAIQGSREVYGFCVPRLRLSFEFEELRLAAHTRAREQVDDKADQDDDRHRGNRPGDIAVD
jgi:hypothetical protein